MKIGENSKPMVISNKLVGRHPRALIYCIFDTAWHNIFSWGNSNLEKLVNNKKC